MVYDFIFNKISSNVRSNIAFIRRNLDVTNLQTEFGLFQNCVKTVLEKSQEDIEDQVKVLMGKIVSFSAPLDNATTFRTISELISSLIIYGYDLYLIKRVDLTEDYPMEDGIAICYLLDLRTSQISGICEGIGRDFEDIKNPVNIVDSVMTWFISDDISLNSDVEQLCFIEQKKNIYTNLKVRNMSIDYNASPLYEFLMNIKQKPLLVTNIIPDEFSVAE